jgi:hypothetical protein
LTGIILAIMAVLVVSFSGQALSWADNSSTVFIDFNGPGEKTGLPKPWTLKVKSGKAHVMVLQQQDSSILHLRCENASYSIERPLSVLLDQHPLFTWRWKAMKLPSSGDVRRKALNDQGLQILLAFENRKVISYVWDANAPEGTVTDESLGWPFNLSVKVIVVKSGTDRVNEWITHTRDVHQDYRNLFSENPPALKGLRIQANTQYTQDRSEGMIQSIAFSRKDTGLLSQYDSSQAFHIPRHPMQNRKGE